MLKGSELIGLSILIDKKIDTNNFVREVIYSKKGFKVLALSLSSREHSYKYDGIILFKKIQAITREGIIISSKNDIVFPYQIPEIEEAYNNPIKIIGFHMYNHHKDLVGVIKDTVVQKKSGKVLAFIISEGIFNDLLQGYSLLPILHYVDFHEDHVIIGDNELKSMLSQGGGLKKFLGIE